MNRRQPIHPQGERSQSLPLSINFLSDIHGWLETSKIFVLARPGFVGRHHRADERGSGCLFNDQSGNME